MLFKFESLPILRHGGSVPILVFGVIGFRSSESGRATACEQEWTRSGFSSEIKIKKDSKTTLCNYRWLVWFFLGDSTTPRNSSNQIAVKLSTVFYMSLPSCLFPWPAIFWDHDLWLVISSQEIERHLGWPAPGRRVILEAPKISQVFPAY